VLITCEQFYKLRKGILLLNEDIVDGLELVFYGYDLFEEMCLGG
jgi:hypothetical protein